MNKQQSTLGLILAVVLAIGAFVFIESGGQLGGKTNVDSDHDLPPVASEKAPGK